MSISEYMERLESFGKVKTSAKAPDRGHSGAVRSGSVRSSVTGRTGWCGRGQNASIPTGLNLFQEILSKSQSAGSQS